MDAGIENVKGRELLRQLANKEITMDEFNKECAYWLISCAKEIQPRMLPTRPRELIEYDNLDIKERSKIGVEFWKQPRIKEYLDEIQMVKAYNKGLLDKLREFKEYIPEEDFVTRKKYDEVIALFMDIPEEVKTARKIFGGRGAYEG